MIESRVTESHVTGLQIPVSHIRRDLSELSMALLRCFPSEWAHDVGLRFLSHYPRLSEIFRSPRLSAELRYAFQTSIPGLGPLEHPLGLAAGFDKNAVALDGFKNLGLSFLEVGTITPLPQPGNPKPRMFRMRESRSLINRMGFNSHGMMSVSSRVSAYLQTYAFAPRSSRPPIGINLGKNKATSPEGALDDFLKGYQCFKELGNYFVINVSSPNTPGLRDLATPEFISKMALELKKDLPKIWIKLDPDMPKKDFQRLIETICEEGYQGVILTNTHRVTYPEAGGLSGAPLGVMSATRQEWCWEVHKGSLPMIASGGILTGYDLVERITRGACAAQIYSALVYRGPFAVYKILLEAYSEMKNRGYSSVSDMIGTFYSR